MHRHSIRVEEGERKARDAATLCDASPTNGTPAFGPVPDWGDEPNQVPAVVMHQCRGLGDRR